jgi:hypothetical protein
MSKTIPPPPPPSHVKRKKAIVVLSGVFILGIVSAVILMNSGIIGTSENSWIQLSASKYKLDVGSWTYFYVSSNFFNSQNLGLYENSSNGWQFECYVQTNSSGTWDSGQNCESNYPLTIAFCCMNYYRNVTSNIIYMTWIIPTG